MELSIPYALVGPDGTRIVYGNSDVAKADPDYVGPLNPDEGITGLDGPDLREQAAELLGGDGGIHYDFFHGRRPIAISGQIWMDGRTPTQIQALEQKVKRATNAMRADAILGWTNTGFPLRRLLLRRQQPPRITGRRPKNTLLAMVSSDYRVLASAEANLAARPLGTPSVAVNAGDELATPRWEITGPAGSAGAPLLLWNATTQIGLEFKTTFAVPAGQLLVVDASPPYPKVTLNGVDRYDALVYAGAGFYGHGSRWGGLVPGNNNVDVNGAAGGTWRLFWRDAWI